MGSGSSQRKRTGRQRDPASADPARQLRKKIESHTARVGILGLGYVGLPLAAEFARSGFEVTGIDPDPAKVEKLRAGESYIDDVSSSELAPLVKQGRLRVSSDFAELAGLDTEA